jgi:capsular exopolysaccharide synthesis family protein
MSRLPRSTSSDRRATDSYPVPATPGPVDAPPSGGGRRLGTILRRRWYLVVIGAVVATVVAYLVTDAKTRMYRAETTLLVVTSPQELSDTTSAQATGTPAGTFDAAKGRGLASLDVVAQRVSAALNGEVSAGQIKRSVSLEGASGTSLIKIAATDSDPKRAAQIATTFSRTYIAFLKEADQSSYVDAAALVRQRLNNLQAAGQSGTEVSDLKAQLQRLEDQAALQTGGLRLVQPALTPDAPYTPRVARITAVGLIGGLVLGLALALAVDALDRRVHETAEFQEIYGHPILGVIPRSKNLGDGQGGPPGALQAADLEAFRILRANLRYVQGAKGAKRILVSSSTAGEGKSTVAWNLAVTAAQGGSRVLLIEADLRQPAITRRYLPRVTTTGLGQVLSGQATIAQALVDCTNRLADTTDEEFGQFCVMLAGGTPPNPADLLASPEMIELLDDVEGGFDLVILDAPPPSLVADAIPLIQLVDGVLVVGRIDVSDRRGLASHRQRLESVAARVLGLVVNGARTESNNSYY